MIRERRHIWVAVAIVTLISWLVAGGAIAIVYPMQDWLFEMGFGLSIATALSVPLTWFVARQSWYERQLTEKLQRLVNRDRLTDASTRDHFFDHVESNPDNHGIFLMIDVDNFKQINDRFGHLAGDEVLRSVVQIAKESCRDCDIVSRFGGEDFVVFLQGLDAHSGKERAEDLRQRIERNLVHFDEVHIYVTVSIGGALKRRSMNAEYAIKCADEALYMAKSGGRNRTLMHDNVVKRSDTPLQ